MSVKIYGIKNCDTMKKAFNWLDAHNITYDFHDYKKLDADKDVLNEAIAAQGWESVFNKRGTTWRSLPDNTKNSMDNSLAIAAALENPSLIKRPLMIYKKKIYLGFKPDIYKDIFL